MTIRVFIVDDQEIVRVGLCHALGSQTNIQVVGESPNLIDSWESILTANPDVLIVDLPAPQANARSMVHRLHELLPSLRILVFADQDSPDLATSMADYGASGFLEKSSSLDDLIVGVRALHAGRVFISHAREVARKPYLEQPSSTPHTTIKPTQALPLDLSLREREVVKLLGEGLTNNEVAQRLFISVKTVETYRARVIKKHRLRGRAALFDFAKRLDQSVI